MVARIVLSIAILLLIPSPSAANVDDPIREFLEGHRTSFSTKGHTKAKGANFTIEYPNSWAASEGKRPNIVQTFVSDGGRGHESAIIVTKQLPLPPGTVLTREDLGQLLAPSELREMLPSGAVLVAAQSTEIDGEPAGVFEYKMRADRAGITFLIHAWTVTFFSANILVQVQFSVSGPAKKQGEVSRRMEKAKPIFTLMASSIMLPDKWNKTPQTPGKKQNMAPSSSSLSSDDFPEIISLIAVSFFFTWGVGLTPPLLIRYAFLRRPLSKKASSWTSAGLSVLFWTAITLLRAASGEKLGAGVISVIIYFLLARWVMSRGYLLSLPTANKADKPA